MNHPWGIPPFSQFTEEGDPDYKKELASCPEFILYEHFREGGPTSVELSTGVEIGYLRTEFGTNDAKGELARIKLAQTLKDLASFGRLFTVIPAGTERDETIKQISGPLLLNLVEQLGVPIAEALAMPNADKRKEAIGDVAAKFKKGLENLHRRDSPKIKRISENAALLPLQRMLVPIAVAQFREDRERPSKGSIRSFLEKMGYQLKKKETWDDNFTKVGLERLPWS